MAKDPFYPMMMTYEVDALWETLMSLSKNGPLRIVEWGSGRSTIYFTRLLKKHAIPYTWVSIEHNPEWFTYVQKEVANDPHVVYRHVPEDSKDTYITAPEKIAAENGFTAYSLALVDGIFRNECIEEAKKIATVTLLHDAQRKAYDATGTFIAGRLLRVGPSNPFSKIQIVRFRIHELLWKLKERLLAPAK